MSDANHTPEEQPSSSNSTKILLAVFGVLALGMIVLFFAASSGGGGGGGGGAAPPTAGTVDNATGYESVAESAQPTSEEEKAIIESAQKYISEEYPDYVGVTPEIRVDVLGGERFVVATYTNAPGEAKPGVTIERILIVEMDPSGEVYVSQTG